MNLNHYVELAKPLLDQYGYLALFGSIFVEGFGIPAPGQTLLVASAILAGKGHMSIVMVLLTAWLAAAIGNAIGYAIGHWGGQKVFFKIGVSQQHFAKVEHYFEKHGGWLVISARFFEVLRQLNGVVAGSMGMPWPRFMWFNMIGATLWVGLWGLGVFWIGEHLSTIAHVLKKVEPIAIIIGIIALITVLWYLFNKRQETTPILIKNPEDSKHE